MSKDFTAQLDLRRVAEQINVILTEIYGKYVAQGSPTKLGGLRFLDVDSAKTFAFEKTKPAPDGNLLVLSAPAPVSVAQSREKALDELLKEIQVEVEAKLRSGPYAQDLRETVVRSSADAGKKNKFFVEAAYYLDTPSWLVSEDIIKVCQEHHCNGNDAVMRILKLKVLPKAADLMDHFISIVRAETVAPVAIMGFSPMGGS